MKPARAGSAPAGDPRATRAAWHALDPGAVAALLETTDTGLTNRDIESRLGTYGPNSLPAARTRSLVRILGSQFASPLIYLLFVAAGIAFVLGHRSDAVVIAVVVLVNAVIGTMQEGRAERSLHALRSLAAHPVRVLRDGNEQIVEASTLVPGDVVLLSAGDAIAADARLLEAAAFQVTEATLTGESTPIQKLVAAVPESAVLADRRSMVFAGTHVTAGRARAIVTGTGHDTEVGHIASLADHAQVPPTPLERRVAQFGRYVMIAAAVLFALIVGIGLVRGMAIEEIVMIGISQVVGVIPEGLPVAMTIALAVGVQRMARRGAIVRRLAAVETLGSTTLICTDKTGTLTRNEMTVVELAVLPDRTVAVTGTGYAPIGAVTGELESVRELIEAGVLCNDAEVIEAGATWTPLGDPTEAALVVVALKAGLVPDVIRSRDPRIAEIPFDSATRLMATQHAGSRPRVIIKGAPEAVLALCGTPAGAELAAAMAQRALRTLAFAVVDGGELSGGFDGLRGNARLLGFAGQIDPPRPEISGAIARARSAGIRPVMITGDHAMTALVIARELDIAREGDRVLEGVDLDRTSDEALTSQLDEVAVFARVRPDQKLRIVELYQRRGEVIAMTGDGVNDAPALVASDVGVAMGATGTDVAKEASDIVITDDDFATIVAAVEEGRVVYRNIKKAILLLFSTSIAEVAVLVLAMALGYPAPFAAVQILWNNLVTEGLITVNLAFEPPEGDEMARPPIPSAERLLTRDLLGRVVVMVGAITVSTLGWFIYRTETGIPASQVQAETFTLLAICEWFNVLNCRSATHTALSWNVLANRWLVGGLVIANALQVAVVFWAPLGELVHTVPFGLEVVVALAVVGSLVLWVEELRKLVARRAG
ncbi:MAG: HAD-IC family P-type ATPase [Kofleriaceae bacterium]